MMDKIKALNKIYVTDYSFCQGELEYVVAAVTQENFQILLDAGFAESDIRDACSSDDDGMDLTYLALNFTDAYCWSKEKGFYR